MSDFIDKIKRQYGDDIFGGVGTVERVSTGIPTVDHVLGGGVPKGRVIEIFGMESSGKTSLALSILAQMKGQTAIIDAEHSLDPAWAAKMGLDMNSVLLCQPQSGEQGLNVCQALVESGEVTGVMVDSVAALVPSVELIGEAGQSHMGLHARLMNQAMRRLTPAVMQNNVVLIMLNQLRHKVGVIFGSPETTPGGMGLKFAASQRIDLRQGKKEEDHLEVKVKVVKNKVGVPFKKTVFSIYFDRGVDYEINLLTLCEEFGIIQKHGSWLKYGNVQLGQGVAKSAQFLRDNRGVLRELKEKICSNNV